MLDVFATLGQHLRVSASEVFNHLLSGLGSLAYLVFELGRQGRRTSGRGTKCRQRDAQLKVGWDCSVAAIAPLQSIDNIDRIAGKESPRGPCRSRRGYSE